MSGVSLPNRMGADYIRAFVIGSSFVVLFPFLLIVGSNSLNQKKYSFFDYALIAPIFLGSVNVLSLYIAKKYNFSNEKRYLGTGVLSATIVVCFSYFFQMYRFTGPQWIQYAIFIYFVHFLAWNYVVYYLDSVV